MRVEKPFLLAEAILKVEWSEQRLRSLVGKGERYIRVKQLPVHLAYFTLSVDEKGDLKSFDDLYGFLLLVTTSYLLSPPACPRGLYWRRPGPPEP